MFLTQIVNGEMSELALCEACAKARGLFDPQSLTFAEKFFPEEFKKQVDKIVRELVAQGDDKKQHAPGNGCDVISACPVCHFTLEDYRRTNRLGCPDCYTFLAHELHQGEEEDTPAAPGKPAPRKAKSPAAAKAELESELQAAVEREDYERAATLRDRIKQLTDKEGGQAE